MKRWIHSKTLIEEEWTIEIYPKDESIQSSTILDTQSNEYQSFIRGMVVAFKDAGYDLYNDPEYTHESNKGSQSWYYTFLRVENLVEIRVVVNVRVSDHSNKDKPWGTAKELREAYVDKMGDALAAEYETAPRPLKVPVEIVFNDDGYTSYTRALFAVRDQIDDIEQAYQEWKRDNNIE